MDVNYFGKIKGLNQNHDKTVKNVTSILFVTSKTRLCSVSAVIERTGIDLRDANINKECAEVSVKESEMEVFDYETSQEAMESFRGSVRYSRKRKL